MYYICIPSRDEERTIGVLLWRIREVMAGLRRDYEVLVLDDGSRDGTAALLEKYRRVMPLAVLSEREPAGYGRAVEKLLRTASGAIRYQKRDGIAVMQGDFTDRPEDLGALVRCFEGGADIVGVGTGTGRAAMPRAERVARWFGRLVLRLGRLGRLGRGGGGGDAAGAADPLHGFRIYRAMVVRAALRDAGGRPLTTTDGWAANAELLARTAPHARRIESVPAGGRGDLRQRPSRARLLPALREIMRLRRSSASVAAAILLAAAVAAPAAIAAPTAAAAQNGNLLVRDTLVAESHRIARIPFAPGEELRFEMRASIFGGGDASMTVGALDTLRGRSVLPVSMHMEGSALGFGLKDEFFSWMDAETLVARRFVKNTNNGKRYREYEFVPEERLVRRIDHDTTWALPTALPLDDISFVYFARTLPLEVGETHTFNRFYKDEGNPVVLKVLRRDSISVPAGKFSTIVVQPIIRTSGLFSEGGEAEIHFSDDERRLVVYMRADMGKLLPTVELKLAEAVLPDAGEAPP